MNICWNFPGNNDGKISGISEAGIETFRGELLKSLAKEICQNSLDAIAESKDKVLVEFELYELPFKNDERIIGLKEYFKLAKEYWKENEKTIRILEKAEKNFKKEKYGHAISTYTGVVYKEIHADELNAEEQNFTEENLRILSALYGILTPFTELKEYRLDMVNSVFSEKSLYEIWKKEINDYFRNEDFIINLASKEYSKILSTDNIYNFEFYDEKDGKLKQISTNSKKMRGFTVNYIIKNKITGITLLKNISLNGYKYNEKMSDERKYVYIK